MRSCDAVGLRTRAPSERDAAFLPQQLQKCSCFFVIAVFFDSNERPGGVPDGDSGGVSGPRAAK
jgi:hypothetical protein